MPKGTVIRQISTFVVIGAIYFFSLHFGFSPDRVSLLLTATICAATVLYASLTFEILLRNQSMAQAASDSASLMERGLRFSNAANLHYLTTITKDPTLRNLAGCSPIENEEYRNALRLNTENPQQMDFVFCIIQNVGHGPATNLYISSQYTIHDTSNPIASLTVPKTADVQLLEPKRSVALLIYVFKVPTANDKATIIGAALRSSDAYRDAIEEPPINMQIDPQNHHLIQDPDCIARLA